MLDISPAGFACESVLLFGDIWPYLSHRYMNLHALTIVRAYSHSSFGLRRI